MSKHHEHALIIFGIVVCAGFLLSVPAIADSGQGLTALKSGELLSFSFDDILTTKYESEPLGVPILLDEDASNAAPTLPDGRDTSTAVPADAGVPETLTGAGAEVVMPADPAKTSSSVVPDPAVGTPSDRDSRYDNERLADLIDTASIRLMRLSMEHAHALYLQDPDAAAVAADDLHALSVRMLGEVQPLQVSPEQQHVKDEFVRSLGAYSTASETLLDTTDAGEESVPTAFRDLAGASESLEAVSQQTIRMQQAGTDLATPSDVTTRAAAAPVVPTGTGSVPVAPTPETLPLQERYTYDDPSGENMVSLLAESARTVTAYQDLPVNKSAAAKVEADEGRAFLLVVVKSTNLGHKGDSDLYAIETPGRDAFILNYQGATFEPMETPEFTLLGESFDKTTLDRYESLKGYLYFDVPASINVSAATLTADLGSAGTPAWDLGRTFSEEPVAAV
ncbi:MULTISPECIES: hypothetical protein [unclassified Methanoculleus]|uniref:hypothetical protein n=1 Tax=unclassified Methanoculleus TaxID=2619537 RepID=UPI0025E3AEE8|nr:MULTISPECIES: hypothetical protein [unclassified Methanoculleus]MCK9318628.1 hypothetical protein [Methanoculleus sp.]MDD2254019.1 hypothetical protein [Methanoculleus sp.]MDD2787262.1 hypothetical protein [Methanoculleus sp.]MDD3216863.1 hypothetical protein [Methanoculleus sp.]MDD4314981.1 hypothetical protein [Methanoculleus sp.]